MWCSWGDRVPGGRVVNKSRSLSRTVWEGGLSRGFCSGPGKGSGKKAEAALAQAGQWPRCADGNSWGRSEM